MGRTSSSIEIKEAQGLTWKDTFFEENEEAGVIAVFDYDYQAVEDFTNSVAVAAMLFPPILICSTIFCCAPCLYKSQTKWETYSKHVCVTQDGIKYVQDKRKSTCGFACSRQRQDGQDGAL